ncbi:MAG: hypothetical protein RPU34_02110 [Candidatus Sedimenticola sp. (ex Thyasira tokunagai)]
MSKYFNTNVKTALESSKNKYLLLGDADHGEKSLKSLAAAVQKGDIKPLSTYGVTTILIEGATRGQERVLESGRYKNAIDILESGQVRVLGCEDKASNASRDSIVNLIENPPEDGSVNVKHETLLNQRIADANESWIAQIKKCAPKVILCCGTSHLPFFNDRVASHSGMIRKLSEKGSCSGYAVEKANSDNSMYIPEKKERSGKFGMVEAIGYHDDWRSI